jgi:hypothetical protein
MIGETVRRGKALDFKRVQLPPENWLAPIGWQRKRRFGYKGILNNRSPIAAPFPNWF